MNTYNFAISTTRVKIIEKETYAREVYLHCVGNGTIYVGGADVTSSNGMLTEKHAVPFAMTLPANEELWAITAADTENVRVLIPSVD